MYNGQFSKSPSSQNILRNIKKRAGLLKKLALLKGPTPNNLRDIIVLAIGNNFCDLVDGHVRIQIVITDLYQIIQTPLGN